MALNCLPEFGSKLTYRLKAGIYMLKAGIL